MLFCAFAVGAHKLHNEDFVVLSMCFVLVFAVGSHKT